MHKHPLRTSPSMHAASNCAGLSFCNIGVTTLRTPGPSKLLPAPSVCPGAAANGKTLAAKPGQFPQPLIEISMFNRVNIRRVACFASEAKIAFPIPLSHRVKLETESQLPLRRLSEANSVRRKCRCLCHAELANLEGSGGCSEAVEAVNYSVALTRELSRGRE